MLHVSSSSNSMEKTGFGVMHSFHTLSRFNFCGALPQTNISPENGQLEDEISFRDSLFSGAMLVSGSVSCRFSCVEANYDLWSPVVPESLQGGDSNTYASRL